MKGRLLYRAWKARLRDQRQEIALARALVQPGDLVVDAGANKGTYVYWLRRAVGPSGKVLAFEPQPTLAAYLRGICAAFDWSNVHIRDVALSNHAGTSLLHVPGSGVSPSASLEASVLAHSAGVRIACSVDTLDRQLRDEGPVSFLKVDVEGHELALFQGAANALLRDKPHLLFECEARHLTTHSMQDVFTFVQNLGYTGYLLNGRSLPPVSEFDPLAHQPRTSPKFWNEDGYFNNFLFVRSGFQVPR